MSAAEEGPLPLGAALLCLTCGHPESSHNGLVRGSKDRACVGCGWHCQRFRLRPALEGLRSLEEGPSGTTLRFADRVVELRHDRAGPAICEAEGCARCGDPRSRPPAIWSFRVSFSDGRVFGPFEGYHFAPLDFAASWRPLSREEREGREATVRELREPTVRPEEPEPPALPAAQEILLPFGRRP